MPPNGSFESQPLYPFSVNEDLKDNDHNPDVNFYQTQIYSLQKQPFRGVLSKKCSENMQQIYKRILMPKCDFNKVALQLFFP